MYNNAAAAQRTTSNGASFFKLESQAFVRRLAFAKLIALLSSELENTAPKGNLCLKRGEN